MYQEKVSLYYRTELYKTPTTAVGTVYALMSEMGMYLKIPKTPTCVYTSTANQAPQTVRAMTSNVIHASSCSKVCPK